MNSSRRTKSDERRIVIVGGGIVGSAIADQLTMRGVTRVKLIEQGPPTKLIGSTGLAPGFIGVVNELKLMTDLAAASVSQFKLVEFNGVSGFSSVGNIEAATTSSGLEHLHHRAKLASDWGIEAHPMEVSRLAELAPDFIHNASCVGGVWYPGDGTARADIITASFKSDAESRGAQIVYDERVIAIETIAGRVVGVRTESGNSYNADDVVLACGIWGALLAEALGLQVPVQPVAHPYVYGPMRVSRQQSQPFVRWPEHHVYARAHGSRLGLGSYDHAGIGIPASQLGLSAERPWMHEPFDAVIERALALLPEHARFTPDERLNGIFAMTPDNLPMLGASKISGLWLAEAIWVTHSAGSAQFLVDLMLGKARSSADVELLDPGRFNGIESDVLTRQALRLYNDIYSSQDTA